jgi:hypothetical protein
LWTGKVSLAIVSAGRGAGKTLGLGVWDTWCLCCAPDMDDISALGGSGKQSKLLQKYITSWRIDVPYVKQCIPISLRGIEPKCKNYLNAEINFLPCSGQSVRGPHVPQVQIDEACVTPDTEILMGNGIIKTAKELSIGDEILSHDGEVHKIEKIFKRTVNEEILLIKPRYFSKGFRITKNHPIMTHTRSGKPKWYSGRFFPSPINKSNIKLEMKCADELRINDLVAIPIPKRKVQDFGKVDISSYIGKPDKRTPMFLMVDEDFCEFLGWYIAEGSTNKDRVFISLRIGEEDHIVQLIRKVFGKEPQLHYMYDCNAVNVFFSSRPLRRFFRDICGVSSSTKHIPYQFMNLPDYKRDRIVDGFLKGDGEINDDYYRAHIASLELIYQFMYINLQKGIPSSIYTPNHGTSKNYEIRVSTKIEYGFKYKNYILVPIREIDRIPYSGEVINFEVEDNLLNWISPDCKNCVLDCVDCPINREE